jgi:putative glutamine amidotransferase
MPASMLEPAQKPPRIGVPWRTAVEETAGKRRHYENYLNAVREAGGDPVEISLFLPDAELATLAESLDAILLPGSPADIEPGRYGSPRHKKTADADTQRERTDSLLLDNAFAARKPVLGICYGTQLMNVHFGGSLVQDIPSELHSSVDHDCEELSSEPLHPVHIEPFDRGLLFEIAASVQPQGTGTSGGDTSGEAAVALVNTSHHQSIRKPGAGFRITARAPDGVIEAIEWAPDSPPDSPEDSPPDSVEDSTGSLAHARRWIVGVQWHPERMPDDALARALFRKLVSEALSARPH